MVRQFHFPPPRAHSLKWASPNNSFERTRSATASGFAGQLFWRAAQLQIRQTPDAARVDSPIMSGSKWRSRFLGSLFILAIACGPAWRRIEPPGAGFTVQMPANTDCGLRDWKRVTPKATWSGRTCYAEAEPFVSWLPFSAPVYIQYSLSWTVVPEEFDQVPLEALLAESEAPEVESRSPIIAGGQRWWATEGEEKYGLEYRTSAAPLGGVQGIHRDGVPAGTVKVEGFVSRERIVLREGKLYRLGVSGEGGSRLDGIWNRMLASFQFVEAPRN